MEQISRKKLITLISILFLCIGIAIISFYNLKKQRNDIANVPEEMNVDYINEIYTGSVNFTELIFCEEIEEGYVCLLSTSSNDINFAYLEKKKDGINFTVKSRAAINLQTLSSDHTIYETVTPLNSLLGNNKFCFSVFTEPQTDNVTVCKSSIPVFKFDLKTNDVASTYGFWYIKTPYDTDITIE